MLTEWATLSHYREKSHSKGTDDTKREKYDRLNFQALTEHGEIRHARKFELTADDLNQVKTDYATYDYADKSFESVGILYKVKISQTAYGAEAGTLPHITQNQAYDECGHTNVDWNISSQQPGNAKSKD